MSEGRLWARIKSHRPNDIWLQRLENGVGNGLPDVLAISRRAVHTWWELKYATIPARSSTPLINRKKIRQEQINWNLKSSLYQVRSWILIGTDTLEMYAVPGSMAEMILELPYSAYNTYKVHSYDDLWGLMR